MKGSLSLALALAVGLIVAACAGAARPNGTPSLTSTPAVAPPDIVFNMKDRYRLGEIIEIRLRNQSVADTYYYQSVYPACYNLKFFDGSTERHAYPYADPVPEARFLLPGQFVIPKGTHCDIIVEEPLGPGQEVLLLAWDQQMCTKDRWGCIEGVGVARGDYRILGEFARSRVVAAPGGSREGSNIILAEWKFVIE